MCLPVSIGRLHDDRELPVFDSFVQMHRHRCTQGHPVCMVRSLVVPTEALISNNAQI